MLRYIAIVLAVVGMLGVGAAALRSAAGDLARISAKTLDQQTVMVSTLTGHGSGVMIGDGLVLTAAHVAVEGVTEKLKITDQAGEVSTATVVWMDAASDVAVIKLDTVIKGYKVADMSCGLPDPQVGDMMQIVGNTLAFADLHTWGRVAAPTLERGDEKQVNLMVNAVVAPGNSGGPVFDAQGRLAGIAVALPVIRIGMGIPNLVTGIAYVIPRSVICKELSAKHDAPVAQGTGKIFPSGNIGP